MELKFKEKLNENGEFLLKRCGYAQIYDTKFDKISYVRRLSQEYYPRYHCYINSEDPLILSLHIDQKKVSYEGFTAHSGDYDSDLVKTELKRIGICIAQYLNK